VYIEIRRWNGRSCPPGSASAWPRRASADRPASTSSPIAWKATCWPRIRKSRSWACCTAGKLTYEQVHDAVLNVARYDVFKL
jgi:hypothetical protein